MSQIVVERFKRNWWAACDGEVKKVTGFSCQPGNPDMWWCPSLEYSLSEKYHLFDTEKEAIGAAMRELLTESHSIQLRLDELKRRESAL